MLGARVTDGKIVELSEIELDVVTFSEVATLLTRIPSFDKKLANVDKFEVPVCALALLTTENSSFSENSYPQFKQR